MLSALTSTSIPFEEEESPPVIFSPSGNDFSGSVMFRAGRASLEGSPLLDTRCSLISSGPAATTFHLADQDTSPPTRFRLPFTMVLPTEVTFSPPPPRKPASGPACDSAFPREPRLISTVPCTGPVVPPWKPELIFTLSATTFRLVTVTGPSLMSDELMVIWWISRAATWVRNGNPAIDTLGLAGKPRDVIWDAISCSANALAPKSRPTSTTTMTTIHTSHLRPRLRRFSCCGWLSYKPTASRSGAWNRHRGWLAAAVTTQESGQAPQINHLDLSRPLPDTNRYRHCAARTCPRLPRPGRCQRLRDRHARRLLCSECRRMPPRRPRARALGPGRLPAPPATPRLAHLTCPANEARQRRHEAVHASRRHVSRILPRNPNHTGQRRDRPG